MNAIHPTPARPAGPCLSAFERRCLIKRMAAQRLIARAVSLAVRLSDADLLMAGEGTTGPVKKKTPCEDRSARVPIADANRELGSEHWRDPIFW